MCEVGLDLLVAPELLQFVGVGHPGCVVALRQHSDISD